MTTTEQPTPDQARQYIKSFREHTLPGADYADFPSGRVLFDNMTDDQAVKVAVALMAIEVEATKGIRKQ